MASTGIAMPSAWRVTGSSRRIPRLSGRLCDHSAVHMARHEATYGFSQGARLNPPQCNLTE